MDFHSFEMRVQLAVGAALKEDPKAVLYEATMPSDYSAVRCVFGGTKDCTITASVSMDGKVKGPVKVSWPWVQEEALQWPCGLNYNDARILFDDEFPRMAWSQVVLRKPTTYPAVNAEYVFTVAGGYVVVDTATKEVYMLKR